jgi:hypothetical protein
VEKGTSVGLLVGVLLAGAVVVAIVLGIAWCVFWRKKRDQEKVGLDVSSQSSQSGRAALGAQSIPVKLAAPLEADTDSTRLHKEGSDLGSSDMARPSEGAGSACWQDKPDGEPEAQPNVAPEPEKPGSPSAGPEAQPSADGPIEERDASAKPASLGRKRRRRTHGRGGEMDEARDAAPEVVDTTPEVPDAAQEGADADRTSDLDAAPKEDHAGGVVPRVSSRHQRQEETVAQEPEQKHTKKGKEHAASRKGGSSHSRRRGAKGG